MRWTVELDSLERGPGAHGQMTLAASEDGRHYALAVAAPRQFPHMRKLVVIRDGVRGEPHYEEVAEMVFSPDGSRLAIVGRIGKHWFVNVDGTESPAFDEVGVGTLAFSPDGGHLAYAVKQGRSCSMIVDGRPEGDWKDIYVYQRACFSTDGRRFAYAARSAGGPVVVIDGVAHPAGDGVMWGGIGFSPDGRHAAWAIQAGRKYHLVVDDVKGPAFDMIAISPELFDRRSGQLIYGVRRGAEWVVRVEDRDSLRVDGGIADIGVLSSPSGGRLACVVQHGRRFSVHVDGRSWAWEFDTMNRGGLAFSPDDAHLACLVRNDREWHVVLDGKPLPGVRCDNAFSLRYSPDGNHLAWMVKQDGGYAAMLDDTRGPLFNLVFTLPTFREDGTLEYFAATESTLYRVRHVPPPLTN